MEGFATGALIVYFLLSHYEQPESPALRHLGTVFALFILIFYLYGFWTRDLGHNPMPGAPLRCRVSSAKLPLAGGHPCIYWRYSSSRFFGFGFVTYFIPSIIAFARSKRDATSTLILNFFLGWTAIGSVIALVWALKQDLPLAAR